MFRCPIRYESEYSEYMRRNIEDMLFYSVREEEGTVFDHEVLIRISRYE